MYFKSQFWTFCSVENNWSYSHRDITIYLLFYKRRSRNCQWFNKVIKLKPITHSMRRLSSSFVVSFFSPINGFSIRWKILERHFTHSILPHSLPLSAVRKKVIFKLILTSKLLQHSLLLAQLKYKMTAMLQVSVTSEENNILIVFDDD